MNHTRLCDVTRPLRTVGRHDHIAAGSSKLDHGAKRPDPSPCTGPPHRLMPEPRDDPGDNFPIAMLADQHMGTGSSVPDRDHQLLGMPKSQDNVASFPVQPIERVVTASLTVHRACDAANDRSRHRRQQGTLHPPCDTLLHLDLTLITLHASLITFHAVTH